MSSPAGGAGAGLNVLGGIAGLAGTLVPTAQGRQDRRITNGEEDPAIAALRRRLAAQNAQTAMSVAASQQGVNPALAQRNAQQALAQQQVQTNANLAQANVQSTQASRNATRQDQSRRMQAATAGVGTLLTGLGTSMGAQAAYDASGQAPAEAAQGLAAPPAGTPAQAAPLALKAQDPVASIPEGAGGLATPVPSASQSAPPVSPSAQAAQAAVDPLAVPVEPAGQMQMRGGEPQLTGTVDDFAAAMTAPQPVAVPAVQEAPVAQAAPAAAPPQAAPEPEQVSLSPEQAVQAMDPSVFEDPVNSGIANMADQLRDNGNPELADVFYRALRQRVSGYAG